jgi:hypothetical protein
VKFYRNNEIEERAALRLSELEALLGRPLTLPIPVDRIAEDILGLDFLWEPIEEMPGESILGAIDPKMRQIVMNETRRGVFQQKPGLEPFTKGHEMGHWDLFLSLLAGGHPSLFETVDSTRLAYRSTSSRQVLIIKALAASPEGIDLLRKLNARADRPDEARAVNRYAAALCMPKQMICYEAGKIDRTRWSNLYHLAEKFNVTISALKVRLEQLDLLRIGKDGTLYASPDEATGQCSLF